MLMSFTLLASTTTTAAAKATTTTTAAFGAVQTMFLLCQLKNLPSNMLLGWLVLR